MIKILSVKMKPVPFTPFAYGAKRLVLAMVLTLSATSAPAGMLGDFQTFTPNTDGLYFITVHSGQVLKKGTLNANAYISYARNYLLAYDSLATMNRVNYRDQLIEWDGTFGYSLTDNFQLFIAMTGLMYQKPDAEEPNQSFLSKGIHSYRPGFKWGFSSQKDSLWALVGSIDLLNVTNDPYTGIDPAAIPNIELVWSGRFSGKGTHGFNFGYRNRKPGATPLDATFYPLKDQLTASYGYSYPWTPKTRLVFEGISCYPLDKGQNRTAQDVSCLEFLGAARYRFSQNWAGVAGATIEAPGLQTMSPAWRVFAGINAYLFPGTEEKATTASREASPLNVPVMISMKPSEVLRIPISGGTRPYQCELVEGNKNDVSLDDCVFTAPPYADTFRVQVSDAGGQVRNTEISVETEQQALTVYPKHSIIIQGQTVPFNASGGTSPLRYSVISGPGVVNEITGLYRASGEPGTAQVRVVDAHNLEDFAVIEVKQTPKADRTLTLKDVNFVFDTTRLIDASKPRLNKAIEVLRGMRIREIIVQGHTDDVGNDEYNRQLSERRAKRIAEILQSELGLRDDQVRAIGFGEDRPLVRNTSELNRQQNRRVELLIYVRK